MHCACRRNARFLRENAGLERRSVCACAQGLRREAHPTCELVFDQLVEVFSDRENVGSLVARATDVSSLVAELTGLIGD